MEAGALNHTTTAVLPGLAGRSPLLRLKSDEHLIALTRKGQHGAFEALVQRYQSRLLAFCRHMLNSTEDAEDVLQEVFAASFNAMIADARPINARPWLYRIARNRCLNHLRRPVSAGQDSMDVFERDCGTTTADTVHKREEFRQIVADVQDLPETQRTALLLREIDALSYDDIATAMDTTVPSVKSLLVRARVSLAEAAEARLLTCHEVRLELGQVAEGLSRSSAPVRRHLKGCERCRVFKGELRRANRALAAVYPLGPLVLIKKFLTAKIATGAGATGASTAGGGSSAAGGAGLAGGAAAAASGAAGSAGAGGLLSAGFGTVASKAVAGFAAAAIVTAGAVEAKHETQAQPAPRPAVAAVLAPAAPAAAPVAIPLPPPMVEHRVAAAAPVPKKPTAPTPAKPTVKPALQPVPATTTTATATATTVPATTTPSTPTSSHSGTPQSQPQPTRQEDGSTVVLGSDGSGSSSGSGSPQGSGPGSSSPPGESSSTPPQQQPAPVVGEPNPSSGAHRRIVGLRALGGGGHRWVWLAAAAR
jgi:RNA polymerase sigma factor (sigma-70 family)